MLSSSAPSKASALGSDECAPLLSDGTPFPDGAPSPDGTPFPDSDGYEPVQLRSLLAAMSIFTRNSTFIAVHTYNYYNHYHYQIASASITKSLQRLIINDNYYVLVQWNGISRPGGTGTTHDHWISGHSRACEKLE